MTDYIVLCDTYYSSSCYVVLCCQDIKAANLLLAEDGAVKLADFGLTVELSSPEELRRSIVGTPYFMSPGEPSHF